MKRILPYLLLNIVVSAATMWIVLQIWQNSHPTFNESIPTFEPTLTLSSIQTTEEPERSYEDQKIEISYVVGAGDLELETITFKNIGSTTVSLQGWKISGSQNYVYTFPSLSVYQGGAFQLYSRSGVNTAIELYAGSANALWQSGSVITLKDPSGKERQQFTVP